MRVALVTCRQYPHLTPDDQPLLAHLASFGLNAEPVIWDEETVDWKRYDAIVIRSPWDYYDHAKKFASWLERIAPLRVLNSAAVLTWNMDKRYLKELEEKGVPIVPTLWIAFEDARSLLKYLKNLPWHELIVKPAISAAADRTIRMAPAIDGSLQTIVETDFVQGSLLMVQPFQEAIVREGEWSFLFFGGRFSHATLKSPAPADFRVQALHGGTLKPIAPPPDGLTAAEAVLAAVEEELLYARVDMVRVEGNFLLMELEVLEPALYLGSHPDAHRLFAETLARFLRPDRGVV